MAVTRCEADLCTVWGTWAPHTNSDRVIVWGVRLVQQHSPKVFINLHCAEGWFTENLESNMWHEWKNEPNFPLTVSVEGRVSVIPGWLDCAESREIIHQMLWWEKLKDFKCYWCIYWKKLKKKKKLYSIWGIS